MQTPENYTPAHSCWQHSPMFGNCGEVSNILRNRRFLYALLKQLTGSPPEKNMFSQLCFLRKLADESDGAKLLCSFLRSLESDCGETIMRETKSEYNRLFVGPNFLPAPPWESVYVDPEHLLFGETTLKVRNIYREFGLQFIHGNNHPDDHIAIELEFLEHLIKMMLPVIYSDDSQGMAVLLDKQIFFLSNHLLKWTPQFGSLLFENTNNLLYQGVALLLLEYIPCDLAIAIEMRGHLNNE
jgi:putative dimethyl sulfoxide reductase chaperone